MTRSRIVITGAAGGIGTRLRPLLRRPDRTTVLFDTAPITDASESETVFPGSILDDAALDGAFENADLVVHLAAIPAEAPWAELLSANIDGTQRVLAGAHRAGVPRVLLASSNHAVGYQFLDELAASPTPPVRPDSFYGVTKATMEALGSLYADRYGMTVVSARIMWAAPEPLPRRGVLAWFSPGDVARLVEAVLILDKPGHHIVWGVSRNGERVLDLSAGREIGFEPVDDAERLRPDLPTMDNLHERLAGPEIFVNDLGERWAALEF